MSVEVQVRLGVIRTHAEKKNVGDRRLAMKTFPLLLVLTLFAIPCSARSAGNQRKDSADPPVSFAGTWKTIAGDAYQYTVILKQVGNKVTGSYSPGNGRIFDGVV